MRSRRDGNTVVVSVKDNGYGIPEVALPHLFEMFYQGAGRVALEAILSRPAAGRA